MLAIGIILFVFMGLFPPLDEAGGKYYGFLLTSSSKVIELEKLLIQWFILSAGIASLIYYLRGEQKMTLIQYIVIILIAIAVVYLLYMAATIEPNSRYLPRRRV